MWIDEGVVVATANRQRDAAQWWQEYKETDGWPSRDEAMTAREVDRATVGFLEYLVTDMSKSYGVALSTQSALMTKLVLAGFSAPSLMPMTKLARARMTKKVPAAVSVAAFAADVFYRLLVMEEDLGHEDSDYLKACYVLGYHGLLRVSEMTLPSTARAPEWFGGRGLMNEDLRFFTAPDGRPAVEITLKWRKNAQRGDVLKITLYGSELGERLDAVAILRKVHRPNRPRAMLLREKRKLLGWRPMTSAWVRRRLKAGLAALGEDPRIHSSHSLRASGATALIATGKWTPTMVAEYGGWSSLVVLRYFRAAMNKGRDAVGDVWDKFVDLCVEDEGK